MNYASVQCVSDFRTPHDFPDKEAELDALTLERMNSLDVDQLFDATNLAGSEHKTLSLLAEFIAGKTKFQVLYDSVFADVRNLIKKEQEENE